MAIADITKPMALDETLQATNGKMDTVVTKLQGIIDALGVDTSVYKAAGNKTCAELVPGLLVASNLGNVYNMTDSGTTTSDFVEGAGKEIHVGDNVAIVDVGTGGSNVYKFDLLAGMVDLTNYIQKSSTAGLVKNDGTIDTNSYATTSQIPDISGKADKVASATSGNLAGLNASGNLTDSGWDGAKTTTSASGNPISITGLKSNQLAVNPVITFEPIQAGSGDPSPSNVRAISGYDKIEVLSCGKNICDVSKAKSIDVSSGTMRNGLIIFLHSGYYTISRTTGDNLYYGIKNRNEDSFVTTGSVALNSNVVINVSDNQLLYLWVDNNSYISRINNLQVEEGQTATTYEPCNKTTDLSESLGQTVYWGELDVRNGKFKVLGIGYDMGDLSYEYASSGGHSRFKVEVTVAEKPSGFAMTSIYQTLTTHSWTYVSDLSIDTSGSTDSDSRIWIWDDRYTDATSFKTAVTGQTIVYELKTPIEIQLTPHEISLLKDYAYVSTNGTNIALDYHNGEIATLGDVSQLGETVENANSYILNDIIGTVPHSIPESNINTIGDMLGRFALYLYTDTNGGGVGLCSRNGFYLIIARHNTDTSAYYIGFVYKAPRSNPVVTEIASNLISIRAVNTSGTVSFNYNGTTGLSDNGKTSSYLFLGNAIF